MASRPADEAMAFIQDLDDTYTNIFQYVSAFDCPGGQNQETGYLLHDAICTCIGEMYFEFCRTLEPNYVYLNETKQRLTELLKQRGWKRLGPTLLDDHVGMFLSLNTQ